MPTPTPDPFNDQGITFFTGPVPQEFIDLTGETTWEGVARRMDAQFAASGVPPDFAGIVVLQVGENGEVERAEALPDQPPQPPVTPQPEEGAP